MIVDGKVDNVLPDTECLWVLLDGVSLVSGSLWIVLLVAVQLVRVVGGHVGEILENVLVGFVSCKRKRTRDINNNKGKNWKRSQTEKYFSIFVTRSYFLLFSWVSLDFFFRPLRIIFIIKPIKKGKTYTSLLTVHEEDLSLSSSPS